MIELTLTLFLFLVAIFGMAIGMILKGKMLQGSCGGIAGKFGDGCGCCKKRKACKNKVFRLEHTQTLVRKKTGEVSL